jgi:hypothetical protein
MKIYKSKFIEADVIAILWYNKDSKSFYIQSKSGWNSPETDKSGMIQELRDLNGKIKVNGKEFDAEIYLDILPQFKDNQKIKIFLDSVKFSKYYKEKN